MGLVIPFCMILTEILSSYVSSWAYDAQWCGEHPMYETLESCVRATHARSQVALLGAMTSMNSVSASTFNSLNRAVSFIGLTKTDLEIADQVSLTSDLIIPSNIRLVFRRGGGIDRGPYSLTIGGPISVGLWQIFYGAGTITFGVDSVAAVYPEWFGAKGDSDGNSGNGNDDRSSLQAAINSLSDEGGLLELQKNKVYRSSDNIHIAKNNVTITGGGHLFFDRDVAFSSYGGFSGAIVVTRGTAVDDMKGGATLRRLGNILDRFEIKDVKISSRGSRGDGYLANHKGIVIVGANLVRIQGIRIQGFRGEMVDVAGVQEIWFQNNSLYNGAHNGIAGLVTSHWHIRGNNFISIGQIAEIGGPFLEFCDNIITDWGGPNNAGTLSGIWVTNSTFRESTRAIVSNNYIEASRDYEGKIGSAIRISQSTPGRTDSFIGSLKVDNNVIVGPWGHGIYVASPPSPGGHEVISSNLIIAIHSLPAQFPIKVARDAKGYPHGVATEIVNNSIFHADGNCANSIDVSGEGLREPPRVNVIGNVIQTTTKLRSEAGANKIGGVIYVSKFHSNYQLIERNYRDGNLIDDSVNTFSDGSTTPSVLGYRVHETSNSSPTKIKNFEDGKGGQSITVIFGDSNTTIDFTGGNLMGNRGYDWNPRKGDHMSCLLNGKSWYCEVSKNTR